MQDKRAAGFLYASQNRIFVERSQRAEINHFDIQAFLLQFFRRVQRCQDLRAERNYRKIAAFAPGARFTNLYDVIVFGKFFAQPRQAIEFLVLEIKHRIGIANRSFD